LDCDCCTACVEIYPLLLPQVRRMVALQTDAFHSPAPLAALDGMARKFFEAEVLSGRWCLVLSELGTALRTSSKHGEMPAWQTCNTVHWHPLT